MPHRDGTRVVAPAEATALNGRHAAPTACRPVGVSTPFPFRRGGTSPLSTARQVLVASGTPRFTGSYPPPHLPPSGGWRTPSASGEHGGHGPLLPRGPARVRPRPRPAGAPPPPPPARAPPPPVFVPGRNAATADAADGGCPDPTALARKWRKRLAQRRWSAAAEPPGAADAPHPSPPSRPPSVDAAPPPPVAMDRSVGLWEDDDDAAWAAAADRRRRGWVDRHAAAPAGGGGRPPPRRPCHRRRRRRRLCGCGRHAGGGWPPPLPPPPRRAASTTRRPPAPAFALDIDGVLLRGGATLPRAPAALRLLFDAATGAPTHPLLFLTNGGGTTEGARAATLADRLGVPVAPEQVVLSHTPLAALAAADAKAAAGNANAPPTSVLVIGGRGCADVAAGYGFGHVLAAADAARVAPSVAPFSAPPRGGPAFERADAPDVARLPVGSVLVLHDSTDWGRDTQLAMDALTAPPPAGSPPDGGNDESDGDGGGGGGGQRVRVIACNADLTFPADHARPRLAQGAFTVALCAVYAAVTGGRTLTVGRLGKPHAVQYALAGARLDAQRAALRLPPVPAIYAVGDNPYSDVAGANGAGGVWRSVLVRTGNWGGTGGRPTTGSTRRTMWWGTCTTLSPWDSRRTSGGGAGGRWGGAAWGATLAGKAAAVEPRGVGGVPRPCASAAAAARAWRQRRWGGGPVGRVRVGAGGRGGARRHARGGGARARLGGRSAPAVLAPRRGAARHCPPGHARR
ncbi:hypothetical protein BU14_0111s0059 [Porphyra umbilicalis]|uniref:TIGR01456 family HAD hydrolase n=1 Tax=Porphyra umbilicalis TaxID=2786 RepID=A0A1X6PCC1_PORUM|nr:hypothetical protein BU14_0111s0059 [Porphyra umbilicalis]|eukprot:OSX78390.1 hypothetical protein BU14_0111s0059 [Porphyra umbilicalis]